MADALSCNLEGSVVFVDTGKASSQRTSRNVSRVLALCEHISAASKCFLLSLFTPQDLLPYNDLIITILLCVLQKGNVINEVQILKVALSLSIDSHF